MIDKRELKKQYKQTLQPMGVYQIRNLVNGKVLIGSSKNIPAKLNSSIFQLKMGTFMNAELQEEFNRYGEDKFSFETLDSLKPKDDPAYDYGEDLTVLEQLWLEKLRPYGDRGYHKEK